MSRKDIFWTVIGCVLWIAAIVLVVLSCLGFLDFNVVFDIFCDVIIGLAIVLLLLVSLFLIRR